MTTTRRHLNEAALSVSKLLGMVTGMTDDEIDEIMDHDEVGALALIAHDLHVYAAEQKFDQTTKNTLELCPYCGEDVYPQETLECPECGRPGCCTEEGGCMPGGLHCICPECEEGDE